MRMKSFYTTGSNFGCCNGALVKRKRLANICAPQETGNNFPSDTVVYTSDAPRSSSLGMSITSAIGRGVGTKNTGQGPLVRVLQVWRSGSKRDL